MPTQRHEARWPIIEALKEAVEREQAVSASLINEALADGDEYPAISLAFRVCGDWLD
ncbi:MAG TPA: hypothetical protein VKQ36_07910 [Ktedonobacterales bacterium]|nr:hypothetical protein [Ktedonobacterales bacterium]